MRVSIEEKEDPVGILVRDTVILREANAVDYSLFLVRYPYPRLGADEETVPSPPGRTSPWRSGIVSRDGKWVSSCLAGFLLGERRVAGESVDGLGEELEFLSEGEG